MDERNILQWYVVLAVSILGKKINLYFRILYKLWTAQNECYVEKNQLGQL